MIFQKKAISMAEPTIATFFQKRSKNTDARNDPAKTQAVSERIPEQASATPTCPLGKIKILPSRCNGIPSKSKAPNTITVTLVNNDTFIFASSIGSIGAEISQIKAG